MARILIAEDEPAERAVLARALALQGHEVTAVGDGAEALAALQADAFDLAIADIVMPVLDGIAFALKASRDHPGVRLILVTGYAAELSRARNIEDLVDRVVSKPYTLAEIGEAVAGALAPRP
jgi:two-component system, cell cycle response regulator CpdR